MDSLRAFAEAVGAFVDRIADVRPQALLLALALHLLNLALRSRAWTVILRAAHPGRTVRWRSAFGAYVAGVGVNALLPARGGDLVKVLAMRRRIEGSTTPTLIATLVAETIVDFVVATSLIVWAYGTGRLPHLPDVPTTGLFEVSFLRRHVRLAEVLAPILLIVALATWRYLVRHVRRLRQRVGQGLAILHDRPRYLRGVVLPQLLGWACRVGTAYFMLEAFRVDATPENAVLVLVVGSVATMVPITPGGAGAQQALLALVLAGAASQSTLLAFSVGSQLATTALNAVLGLIALPVLFRGLRIRSIVEHARRHHEEETGKAEPGGRSG